MNKSLSFLRILFIPCSENNFRPRFLKSKFLLYYVAGLAVLSIIAAVFLVSLPKTAFFADVTKSVLITLTNQERENLGLAPLKENIKLNGVALEKAKDMLANNYFAHSSPTGVTPWHWFQNAGYRYQAAGENLAIGFIDSQEVVDAWIESPSHRANLLNSNFKEIGIAVLTGKINGQETTLVVQSFGSPAKTTNTIVSPENKEVKTEESTTTIPEQKPEKPEPVVAAAAQFITIDYFNIARKVLFYSIILVAIALVLNIFIHIKIQDKALILRSVILLALLVVLIILMGKDAILQFIPHNLQI